MADEGGHAACVHYEQLRSCAAHGRTWGVRHGLAVLMQQGMAAWIEAFLRTCPVPLPARPAPASSQQPLAVEHLEAVVNILTNMALSRIVEIPA